MGKYQQSGYQVIENTWTEKMHILRNYGYISFNKWWRIFVASNQNNTWLEGRESCLG